MTISFDTAHNGKFLAGSLILLLGALVMIPNAYAIPPVWIGEPFTLKDGNAGNGSFSGPIIVQVTDAAANTDPLAINTISVTITSGIDPTGIVLTLSETGVNTGIFQNTNLAPMVGNDVFSLSDTGTIAIFNDLAPDPAVQTLSGNVLIVSDSDLGGIFPDLIETGPDTNLYTATLRFGASTDPATNTLGVAPGDIISVIETSRGNIANGIISPNPNGGKGAIAVTNDGTVSGTVTATYQGDSTSITIDAYRRPDPGGGGGGCGGLVCPSLVVDAKTPSASSGSGCKGDCTPPTLGVDETYRRLVNGGFSYNEHPVDVELYYTHYPLITTKVSQENKAVLKIYDNSGPQHIKHVELVFGLGKGQILDQSKAAISLDISSDGEKVISTYDPENVLQDIRAETTSGKCSPFVTTECLIVTIYHTFRAPLDFNIVATDVWDFDRNEWQNYYNDGIEVIGESLNPPKEHLGIYRGHPISIIETGKNTAIDENGNTWTFDKVWMMDYKPVKKIDVVTSQGYDRNHNDFPLYKKGQELLAQHTLGEMLAGKKIHDESAQVPKVIIIDYVTRQEDKELQIAKITEALRAKELLDKSFSSYYVSGE